MHNTSNETMLKLLKQINVEMKKRFLIEAQQAASQDNMKIAIQYRTAEIKQLEKIEELKSKQKSGKSYVGFLGSYEAEIKNASNLATIYANKSAQYLEKAKKGSEYFTKEIQAMYDDIDSSFAEPSQISSYRKTPEALKEKETGSGNKEKEKFRANMEKTLAQKKAELEYKMQADLVNANKEEENIIKLKYASQAKILEIKDTFAKEAAGAKTQKQVEAAYDVFFFFFSIH